MKNLLKKTRKTWENAWKKLYIPTHPINQQVSVFQKLDTVPAHRTYQETTLITHEHT
jgi:hypothetical protein